ncbi:hypothetical protein COBT_000216 [Conglomerata obtusa]
MHVNKCEDTEQLDFNILVIINKNGTINFQCFLDYSWNNVCKNLYLVYYTALKYPSTEIIASNDIYANYLDFLEYLCYNDNHIATLYKMYKLIIDLHYIASEITDIITSENFTNVFDEMYKKKELESLHSYYIEHDSKLEKNLQNLIVLYEICISNKCLIFGDLSNYKNIKIEYLKIDELFIIMVDENKKNKIKCHYDKVGLFLYDYKAFKFNINLKHYLVTKYISNIINIYDFCVKSKSKGNRYENLILIIDFKSFCRIFNNQNFGNVNNLVRLYQYINIMKIINSFFCVSKMLNCYEINLPSINSDYNVINYNDKIIALIQQSNILDDNKIVQNKNIIYVFNNICNKNLKSSSHVFKFNFKCFLKRCFMIAFSYIDWTCNLDDRYQKQFLITKKGLLANTLDQLLVITINMYYEIFDNQTEIKDIRPLIYIVMYMDKFLKLPINKKLQDIAHKRLDIFSNLKNITYSAKKNKFMFDLRHISDKNINVHKRVYKSNYNHTQYVQTFITIAVETVCHTFFHKLESENSYGAFLGSIFRYYFIATNKDFKFLQKYPQRLYTFENCNFCDMVKTEIEHLSLNPITPCVFYYIYYFDLNGSEDNLLFKQSILNDLKSILLFDENFLQKTYLGGPYEDFNFIFNCITYSKIDLKEKSTKIDFLNYFFSNIQRELMVQYKLHLPNNFRFQNSIESKISYIRS